MEKAYFPMFVDLSEKKIVIVGGGKIAARRAETLTLFASDITVIAPAATNNIELNHSIAGECRELERSGGRRILLSVADDRSLCDFYFPSVIQKDEIVIGINSGGSDPGKVKQFRKELEKKMGL